MDQDAIITKRLHVSGLTPAITKSDLSQRLGSFGTVLSLDGLGQLDAVGQPRKFAYVTVQASKEQLARCMNLLSGTTWKGTKLRIGEAKPDFRERISREQDQSQPERQKKRRRLARGVQGVQAADMTLVTPLNVQSRKGWHITPLGRLIRPMRMRPVRPLPSMVALSNRKIADPKKKQKRRFKQALIRSRRRSIDPLKWGSQHLKGAFLDSTNVILVGKEDSAPPPYVGPEVDETDETNDEQIPSSPNPEAEKSPLPAMNITDHETLVREKIQSLSLLESMFGKLDDDTEWGGKEDLDSDLDMDDIAGYPADNDIVNLDQEVMKDLHPASPPPTKNKLKDLFVPQEEQGFSLLGHLDLDLELDEDPIIPTQPPIPQDPVEQTAPIPLPQSQVTFDPKQLLFFPLSQDARSNRGKSKDILDVMRERGFDWRVGFYRSETSEEIAKRWEETKGDLTRDWKRRHREAVKSRRRRGGADGDSL